MLPARTLINLSLIRGIRIKCENANTRQDEFGVDCVKQMP